MEYRCIGCGALLQSIDEDKPGYIEKQIFEVRKESSICKRCFAISHYNKQVTCDMNSDDYLKLIQTIANKDALIISLVDIFDFAGTFLASIKRHTGQEDIILVGNKRDIIPHSVKNNKLKKWMRHMAKQEGLSVLDAEVISAKTGEGIDRLMDLIDQYRRKRNVYIVGMTNVGKSTLVNTIIKKYSDQKRDVITTSTIPGTTLDFIEIPYQNGFIIDTPGIINGGQLYHFLSQEAVQQVMPRKEIKPRVYQIESGQCVFISSLAIMKYIKGEKNSFVFYFSDTLNVHRTKIINMERIKESFNEAPLTNEKITYTTKSFKIPADGLKYDIVVSGLGFISVKGEANVQMEVMNNVDVYLRESII